MTTGAGGRPQTPTALKILRGEKRESRLNRQAPKPRGAVPIMPKGMRRAAQAVWRRQTRAMAQSGVLTVVDSDSIRVYCDAVARYEEAEKMLAEQGPLVGGTLNADGLMVGGAKNPLHQVVRDNAMLVDRLATHLAFQPHAREGIRVGSAEPTAPASPLQAWEAASG